MKKENLYEKLKPIVLSNENFKNKLKNMFKEKESVEPNLETNYGIKAALSKVLKGLKGDDLYQKVRQITDKNTTANLYDFDMYKIETKMIESEKSPTFQNPLPSSEAIDTIIEENSEGEGSGRNNILLGLDENQINIIISKFPNDKLKYVGTFCYDEFWNFLETTDKDDFCCILNSNERQNKTMGHWMAFNCDKRTRSLEFYDSFGTDLGRGEYEKLMFFSNKISPNISLKYKYSSVKEQSDKSDTCGWFSIYFLLMRRITRFSFEDSTGFSNITGNEKQMQKFKGTFSFV